SYGSLLLELREPFLRGVLVPFAEGGAFGEGKLEEGAFQVIDEYIGIVGIDSRFLGAPSEKVFGVGDDVLVEGRRRGHEHGQRDRASSSSPARLLPEAREGAGEACDDGCVEAADIDAQLERDGRHDSPDGTLAQAPFYRASLAREEAGPVGTDLDRAVAFIGIGQRLGYIRSDELHLQPGAREK